MESLGVPWFVLVRQLGPPAVLLVVGIGLTLWRRPARGGLVTVALVVNLLAAALPFVWILLQVGADLGTQTWAGLVTLLVQPLVTFTAWMLLLIAVLSAPPRTKAGPAPQGEGTGTVTGPADRRDTQWLPGR
ncbi:hypothetical protein [Nocardiopsis ansamitocini]|uniref:Uncharacterized protein n=1 Tax=Nocardiopsis ansamitocini TaxID=1670832 RepID=A0A9W6P9I5_9ACTN|nr:hypothetical protein [Nocardiopsis ansamitocini]GLU49462.1 hypothetical protein Nans01_38130 [Nocardiopsis ansamitocini]